MQTTDEVNANVLKFEGKPIDEETKNKVKNRDKRLHIDSWCVGCGNCMRACQSGALKIENDKAVVDKTKCLLCGYCSAYCTEFCIKIV
jgi:ferredoxin